MIRKATKYYSICIEHKDGTPVDDFYDGSFLCDNYEEAVEEMESYRKNGNMIRGISPDDIIVYIREEDIHYEVVSMLDSYHYNLQGKNIIGEDTNLDKFRELTKQFGIAGELDLDVLGSKLDYYSGGKWSSED